MSWLIIDAATAAAFSAPTTQRARLEALAAPWAGGAVTVRWFEGDTLLRTQTYPAISVDTVAEPYRFTFGRFVADSHVATGTADRVVLRAGSTDIVQASVGSTVTLAGAIKELCPPNLEGVSILADAGLPAEA